jgi:hypothetical protein
MPGAQVMTIPIEKIAVILTATVLAVAAPGKVPELLIGVSTEKQSVRLGDSIKVSVRVTNQGTEAAVASRSMTAFDCFEVTGPDGKRLPYVGFDGQVGLDRLDVRPASTATIAESLDLTDKYLFQKPGRYSIRFNGKSAGLSDSPAIAIEVTPGQISEVDSVVVSLLPVCPKGWHIVKDGHGEVTPFGPTRVPGFVIHICRNHMRGEAVFLWFTKEEAMVDPKQQPRGQIEYLGRLRGLFVYESVGENTPPLWPRATEEISRALQSKNGELRR